MGYIYLVDEIGPGQAARQVVVDDGDQMIAVLDFDSEGHLLGIELFRADRQLHPDLVAIAE